MPRGIKLEIPDLSDLHDPTAKAMMAYLQDVHDALEPEVTKGRFAHFGEEIEFVKGDVNRVFLQAILKLKAPTLDTNSYSLMFLNLTILLRGLIAYTKGNKHHANKSKKFTKQLIDIVDKHAFFRDKKSSQFQDIKTRFLVQFEVPANKDSENVQTITSDIIRSEAEEIEETMINSSRLFSKLLGDQSGYDKTEQPTNQSHVQWFETQIIEFKTKFNKKKNKNRFSTRPEVSTIVKKMALEKIRQEFSFTQKQVEGLLGQDAALDTYEQLKNLLKVLMSGKKNGAADFSYEALEAAQKNKENRKVSPHVTIIQSLNTLTEERLKDYKALDDLSETYQDNYKFFSEALNQMEPLAGSGLRMLKNFIGINNSEDTPKVAIQLFAQELLEVAQACAVHRKEVSPYLEALSQILKETRKFEAPVPIVSNNNNNNTLVPF